MGFIFEGKDASPVVIRSSRLEVEISRPGVAYQSTRFDWTTLMTQITLDGSHTFCVPESYTPGEGTGGIGLCNEFGIQMPIGYDDAGVGEFFPKIGVGLIKKTSDAPYEFWKPYEFKPFPVKISADKERAVFLQEPVECRGYAFRLEKTAEVCESTLKIAYKLENTGSREIDTNEYNHNFVGIDGHLIGKDYSLRFPHEIEVHKAAGEVIARSKALEWEKTPEEDFYCVVEGYSGGEPYKWELIHRPSGVGMREVSKFPTSRIAVWGRAHVVSPEMFIGIKLKPGEKMEWVREYEFFI